VFDASTEGEMELSFKADGQMRLMTLLMVCSSLFLGCIAFKGNELEPAESLASVDDGVGLKPTASITWERRYVFRGKEDENLGSPGGELLEIDQVELLDVLRESGAFSKVYAASDFLTPEEQAAIDLAMTVSLVRLDSEAAVIAAEFLSRLTLMTIPFWQTRSYRVDVRAETTDGEVYEYQLEDSMTDAFWLPLAVISPFFTPSHRLAAEIRKNIYRTLLVRMKRDGLLTPSDRTAEAGREIPEARGLTTLDQISDVSTR